MDEQMIADLFAEKLCEWSALGKMDDPTEVAKVAAREAAHSVIAGRVAELQQRIEAAFVKGADVAVFIANQRQNPQPPTGSQLDEIADFLAAVRDAL